MFVFIIAVAYAGHYVEREMFDAYKEQGFFGRQKKGLYVGEETGLIVADTETTLSRYSEDEYALSNPETFHALLNILPFKFLLVAALVWVLS